MSRRTMKLARRETVAAGTEAFTFDYGSEPFSFTPGQAIDLFVRGGLKMGIIQHQHAFTIAGSGGASAIQIATRMRNSEFKQALGELKIGEEVEVDGPWGEFIVPSMTTDVVCLAGGIGVTLTLSGTTTVTVDISTDPVWTASGGSITARYAVIYEVGGDVLCYSLLDTTPADVTATDGNTFTVAAHTNGVFTLA